MKRKPPKFDFRDESYKNVKMFSKEEFYELGDVIEDLYFAERCFPGCYESPYKYENLLKQQQKFIANLKENYNYTLNYNNEFWNCLSNNAIDKKDILDIVIKLLKEQNFICEKNITDIQKAVYLRDNFLNVISVQHLVLFTNTDANGKERDVLNYEILPVLNNGSGITIKINEIIADDYYNLIGRINADFISFNNKKIQSSKSKNITFVDTMFFMNNIKENDVLTYKIAGLSSFIKKQKNNTTNITYFTPKYEKNIIKFQCKVKKFSFPMPFYKGQSIIKITADFVDFEMPIYINKDLIEKDYELKVNDIIYGEMYLQGKQKDVEFLDSENIVNKQIENNLKNTKNHFENTIKEIQKTLKLNVINTKQDVIQSIILRLLRVADWNIWNPKIVNIDYENYEVKTYIQQKNKRKKNNSNFNNYKILFKIVDKNILNNKNYDKLLSDIYCDFDNLRSSKTKQKEIDFDDEEYDEILTKKPKPKIVIITDGIIFRFHYLNYRCYCDFKQTCFLNINLLSPKIFERKNDFLFFLLRDNFNNNFAEDVAYYRRESGYYKIMYQKDYQRDFMLVARILDNRKKHLNFYIEHSNNAWFLKQFSTLYRKALLGYEQIKPDIKTFPTFKELVNSICVDRKIPNDFFKWKISYNNEVNDNVDFRSFYIGSIWHTWDCESHSISLGYRTKRKKEQEQKQESKKDK